MLKIMIPTLMMLLTTWLSSTKWLWLNTITSGFFIAMMSLMLFNMPADILLLTNKWMGLDYISSPLLILTCWLFPLMILASKNHLKNNPMNRQRTYISMLVILQAFLILAFTATEMIMFYIAFEGTLIPTLIVITRWGNQAERLNAGTYFLFYTIAGSLPLLAALMILNNHFNSLSLILLNTFYPMSFSLNMLMWAACLLAFLVKMPLYGMHLWLPKAHVEAPIAGSMILAAVLLKLGGYGIIRITFLLAPLMKEMSYPFIIMAMWGVVMTGLICMRQTDLKSLIAYSSVSHMGLVIAATLIQTPWSIMGAMALMISHGLISSALFCLANLNYERTNSRTLILVRGAQTILPLMATWWLLINLFNMALPPSTNLYGELTIIISMFNWSNWTILMTGFGTLITVMYSLYMFLMTQRGPTPHHLIKMTPTHTREHYLILMHLLPMLLLMFNPSLIFGGM
uniref:NADH-ubiquinone oxidoreductase chain 4 n=1 Tax=Necturus beyeri TaxID=324346 RepID=C9DHF6_9SALA|nr:NADH dehydrogenase subunit 4 [Necturus beyeri]ACU00361.1 NADH dehydrogenase subunit 4 [Necturus beyeri]